jgi:hypothetical protein
MFWLIIATVFSQGTATAADILRVPGDPQTIQAAINKAKPGDTILVTPGTYKVTYPVETGHHRQKCG